MSAPKSDLEWLIQLGREGNQPHAQLVERASVELNVIVTRLQAAKRLVKKWRVETDDADAEIVDRYDRELTAYVATMNGCIEELAVALGMENKK